MRAADGSHTTNYTDTFIEVAEDCPVDRGVEPPDAQPTVAALHYALAAEPYTRTSDEVMLETQAVRHGLTGSAREAAREAFFARGQACMRTSPLGKRYGWGIHFDHQGRIALYPVESADYVRLAADPALAHTRAMRSHRS